MRVLLMKSQQTNVSTQGSVSFSCKRPETKCSRLCGSSGLSPLHISGLTARKKPQVIPEQINEHG